VSSHRTPLVCRWYGSGGASPVGRRRRARRTVPGGVRWVSACADWSAGRSMTPPNPRRPGAPHSGAPIARPIRPSRLRDAPITVKGRRPPQKPEAASSWTSHVLHGLCRPVRRKLPFVASAIGVTTPTAQREG
jgi:hypothetical protein